MPFRADARRNRYGGSGKSRSDELVPLPVDRKTARHRHSRGRSFAAEIRGALLGDRSA